MPPSSTGRNQSTTVTEADFHGLATIAEMVLALCAFAALTLVTAPYGRHDREGWGPAISARVGWMIMESTAVVCFAVVYCLGDNALDPAPLILGGMWMLHYLYRAFVFPFRIRDGRKRMRLIVVALGVVFNTLNSYIVARWISEFGHYETGWLAGPQFMLGAATFAVGFATHYRADGMLIHLRGRGEKSYRIPSGWLYEYVACPNYLGEITEWTGYAIATWSLPGLAFALFTAANLVPRARANLRWYRRTFPDYPPDRKALIPFVW